jgi:hypothetical protein
MGRKRAMGSLRRSRREALLLAIFGGFGLAVLPALVYFVGQVLLGAYRPDAGMGAFYGDLYGHLGDLSPWAWLLVMGPYLAVQFLRLLWLPVGGLTRRRHSAPRGPGGDGPGPRVEPPFDAAAGASYSPAARATEQ